METNKKLRDEIFKVINNQIKDNNPPETKEAYDRLRKQGFDDLHAKQLLGQCLAIELFDIIKFDKPFDNERYTKNLLALPKEPS